MAMNENNWLVYILRCKDGSLYTGVTNNIERRIKMHDNGSASRYTRVRLPVKLIYHQSGMTRSQALIRECAIKKMTKQGKEQLIQSQKE